MEIEAKEKVAWTTEHHKKLEAIFELARRFTAQGSEADNIFVLNTKQEIFKVINELAG